jgi:uncharacterized protein (DUF427 family)
MGLAWQQGPLATGSVGHFISPDPLPARMLFAEPLRRRMRVEFDGEWLADSENVILLHEPGHYPVAYFPRADVRADRLQPEPRTTQHRDLGETHWFAVGGGDRTAAHSAWQHVAVPEHAREFDDHIAFAWRTMDAFYEEDERIVGHAADLYHRNDIRQTSRHLVVKVGERTVADTHRPVVLYESGFAPRWYVPRDDIDATSIEPIEGQTFCPYKGLASYYSVADKTKAAWSYLEAWPEVGRIANLVSFEPDVVDVFLDGRPLALEPGQTVIAHGVDRALDPDEIRNRSRLAPT